MVKSFLDDAILRNEVPSLGWTCTHTPEELMLAAGFQPVRIAETPTSTKLADAYFHSNLCPYVKNCLDFGLKDQASQMKGIVIANSCNAMRIFYHYWSRYVDHGSFVHFINVPKKSDDQAVRFFNREIQGLKSALERFFSLSISEESLWKSIDIYNESRALMAEINSMRREDAFPIKNSQLFHITRASQHMPRADFNRELKKKIDTWNRQKRSQSFSPSARIMVLGSLLSGPQLFEIVEQAGAGIVYDDLCSGSRYFENPVEKKGDPIQALAIGYLRKSPCARMKNTGLRLEKAKKKIDEYRVDGVIYVTVKFCDNHLYDFPVFKEELEKSGIPVLQIEEDFKGGNVGQIRTRVEAFVEML